MARLLGIFLFLSYIFSATEFKQLIKVTSLLEHYSEHKENNSRISFFDFLYMHYAGDDFVQTDNDRDMDLPFKKFDNTSSCSLSAVLPVSTKLYNTQQTMSRFAAHKRVGQGLGYSASIWQPPRFL